MVRQLTCKHNLAFFIFQPSPLYFWSFPCRAVATNEKQANYYAAPNQKNNSSICCSVTMAPPCQASNRNGTATPGVPHGDNCEVQCSPDVRKKPRFTHVRDNLHGDVSEKRFSTHAVEVRWLELDRASVETTKGWKEQRESEGNRVG